MFIASGYRQVSLVKDSIDETTFIIPDGHYEYLEMLFGVVNATIVFQKPIQ